jgi:hypothetical protein
MMNAQSSRISATRPAAEIQMIERVMRDKNMTFTEAAEYLQGVKGINALRTSADKEWNESRMLRMDWNNNYQAYMASKGLSVSGQGAPKVMSMADVKETAKKSGRTEKEVIDAAKSKGYTIQ